MCSNFVGKLRAHMSKMLACHAIMLSVLLAVMVMAANASVSDVLHA